MRRPRLLTFKMSEFSHKPVLFRECIEMLDIKPDGIYVDGTLGGAGHSCGILERLGKNGLLIGIDQDSDALEAGTARLKHLKDTSGTEAEFITCHANFENIRETVSRILRERGMREKADGILLDIGVSSYQFDEAERGFSYRYDGPLDMRMDRSAPLSADHVVNTYSQARLTTVIKDYGEEKWARAIASAICREREKEPVHTTFRLAEIVKNAIPPKDRQKGRHPAMRTFQAIRIEVNRELEVLDRGISGAIDLLEEGGRLAVITFHSLEDRIVKNRFREAQFPCVCPPDFPVCVCGRKPLGKMITGKPVTASEIEQSDNNRSHSAKLRVFEKHTAV